SASTRCAGPARRRLTGGAPVPRKLKAIVEPISLIGGAPQKKWAAASSGPSTSLLVRLFGGTAHLLQLGEDGVDVDLRFLFALGLAQVGGGLARGSLHRRRGLLGRQQGRADLGQRGGTVLGGAPDLEVEIDLRAQAEADRVDRRQGLGVPVRPVADLRDGRLGG